MFPLRYSFASQDDEESPFLDFPPVFILFILSTVLFGLPTAYISSVLLLFVVKTYLTLALE